MRFQLDAARSRMAALNGEVRMRRSEVRARQERAEDMATYFVFSDESGKYNENYRNRGHKYFVRSALLFDSANWLAVKTRIDALKVQAQIPVETEFKWNYMRLIYNHQKGGRRIRPKGGAYPFRKHDIDELIAFVRRTISLFHRYGESKIICTFTENLPIRRWRILLGGSTATEGTSRNPTRQNICKWHLQELMQRVEMEMQRSNSLAVVFFDEESDRTTEKHVRNCYHDMYHNGDFIKNYQHIKDSLCFEDSSHSTGIQVADYIAGIFNAFLNDDDISYALMRDCILPILRKESTGDYLGYGIREVPRDESKRQSVSEKIKRKLLVEQRAGDIIRF